MAAVVEVGSALEEVVVALPADLRVEEAMPDQHRQGNSYKDWAA